MIITHEIAGITIQTNADIPIPLFREKFFLGFKTVKSKPDILFRIRQINPDSLSLSPLDDKDCSRLKQTIGFPPKWVEKKVFRSSKVRDILKHCLIHPEQVSITFSGNRAIIRDFPINHLDFLYLSEKRGDLNPRSFTAGYRNLIGSFFPNFSAVMIHGAGVIRSNLAAVFLAPDGGGKSTVIKQSIGSFILNDDHLVLSQENGDVVVHGTPLGPLTNGPQKARLGGIFLLEKSNQFSLKPLSPYDIIKFILEEQTIRMFLIPKNLRLKTFDILYSACFQVPVYQMSFPIDYVDWNAIDLAMVR